MAEDRYAYQRPADYYNGQLMTACGLATEPRLDRTRQRAIDAGLLHYVPGGKRIPGTYWVLDPDRWGSPPTNGIQNDGANVGASVEKPEDKRRTNVGLLSPSRPPSYIPEDMQTAQAIWDMVVAIQPERKPPKFDTWANDVRLMRTSDGRTHAEILDLFRRANSDKFWRTNILSPAKLREKWDDLTLKLGRKPSPQAGPNITDDVTEAMLARIASHAAGAH